MFFPLSLSVTVFLSTSLRFLSFLLPVFLLRNKNRQRRLHVRRSTAFRPPVDLWKHARWPSPPNFRCSIDTDSAVTFVVSPADFHRSLCPELALSLNRGKKRRPRPVHRREKTKLSLISLSPSEHGADLGLLVRASRRGRERVAVRKQFGDPCGKFFSFFVAGFVLFGVMFESSREGASVF
ncbi:unnamed protein product [Victoria cruziana]